MSSADERKRARADWKVEVFRGPDALGDLERDARREWEAMAPVDRLALTWELSLAAHGLSASDEPRLPRSAYRVERR
jgi:hypothetical protein